jgi:hypothetical protein
VKEGTDDAATGHGDFVKHLHPRAFPAICRAKAATVLEFYR